MTNRHIAYLIISFIVLSNLFACQQNIYFESKLEIPESSWESEKAAVFDFTISDTLQSYNLIIEIVNTNNYRNSNLWLFMRTHSSNGEIASDTIEFFLATEKGKWLGKKNGGSWQNDLLYKSNVRFPGTGKYSVEIIQGMRDLKLKGIKQVGIKIEEIN